MGGFILENNPEFKVVLLNESIDDLYDKRFGFCNISTYNMNKIQKNKQT